MAQRPALDTQARQNAPPGVGGDDDEPRPSAELRVERSRFSRLLARFGLGELTDPILRPTKHSAGRGSTG
jgi:hypothetical protein